MDENNDLMQYMAMMRSDGDFDVRPAEDVKDIADSRKWMKIETTREQKMQVSAFAAQMPAFLASQTMAQAYICKFPAGVNGTLVALKKGGFSSMIRGANGQFVSHASYIPIGFQAALTSVFSVMSIATSQYYLKEINSEMKMIRQDIDRILEFLYGNKKAELLAEASFIRYAYENYISIMQHDEQRLATIQSIQAAKKTAMTDIEFYMTDLESTVSSAVNLDVKALYSNATQLRQSLEFSIQLYGMACVLESYFAQNSDQGYLRYVSDELARYITKCDKRILSSYILLKKKVEDYKVPIVKLDKTAMLADINSIIGSLNEGDENALKLSLQEALSAGAKESEYYITSSGDMYVNVA